MGPGVLSCVGVAKRFGGLAAIRHLDLEIEPGRIHGIAGANGAGKTTLFNVITGHTSLDEGQVFFDDREITRWPAHARYQLGIARTFQSALSISSATVEENALGGAYFKQQARSPLRGFPDDVVDRAHQALAFVGLTEKRSAPAATLSVFDKKRLMMASALASRPGILLLDEPFGGLNRAEMTTMIDLIRGVNARGVTILIIEHVLKALFELSQHLTVMHHGSVIFEGKPQAALTDAAVVESYLGSGIAGTLGERS